MNAPAPNEEEIFSHAAALVAAERAAYLRTACAGQETMLARIESLLGAHEDTAFMQCAPPGGPRAVAEAPGDAIGHFRLVEPLGEGGFGVVWLADQLEPIRRRVALKIIKLGMDTREVIARFEQERQALAMMDHPHIAKVFDAGATPAGRPFFAMELVRGERITDFCDARNLPLEARLQLFMAVCQAVQHAHQKGVIHRDLKPSNILVAGHDGVPAPKIIDFGVAKATQPQPLTDLTLFTHHEQMIGTPLYMSPEQAEWGGVDIDTRSDLYSLGVLLYELLTGRTPFDPESLTRRGIDETRRAIRELEPRAPSIFVGTMSPERRALVAQCRQTEPGRLASRLRGDLDWIAMKALEKDRSRRYETATDLAADLKRHLASEPILARPASQLYRFRRAVRRNKLAFASALVVAAALLAGLGFSTWSFFNEQEQRRVADAERRAAEVERGKARANEQAARQQRYVSDIALAWQAFAAKQFGRGRRLLDAHRPRVAGADDLRGWEWRWLWQQLRGEPGATLSRHTARASSVSFSPDGRRVAVGYSDGRVEVCAVTGGTTPQVLQTEGPVARVAFSPVADALVFSGQGGVVKRLDFSTQRETVLCQAPADVHDLSYSRDGALLALLTRTRGGKNPWPDSTPRVAAGAGAGSTMVELSTAGETALVVDAAEGRVRHTVAVPPGSGEFFNNVRLSLDHARLYVTFGTMDKLDKPRLRCVQLADGATLWEAAPPPAEGGRTVTGFSAMDLSPDGRVLATATGYDQRTIQLWDALTGTALRTLEGHTDYVMDLAFSPDGRTLASASSDETVRLWDTRTWVESAEALSGNGDEVEAVAFSPDGARLATGSKDGLALLWEPAARAQSRGRRSLPAATKFGFLIPGGRYVFSLAVGNRRSFIDVATGRETPLALTVPTQGFYGGPNFLGYPGTPRGFQLFEIVETGAALVAAVPLAGKVTDWFAYSPEARLLAWAEPGATTIHVTHIDPPHAQTDLVSDGEICLPTSFDATGKHLLAVGPYGDARVWDLARRTRLPAAEDYLSPFGMTVVGNLRNALGTRAIRDWVTAATHPPAGPRRFTRTATAPPGFWPAGAVTCRAYSPDGRTTAVGTENGSILLFDAATQEKLRTLHGRAHSIFALAFTPDGKRIVSASDAIWDVETGQELVPLPANGALHSIAQFSDDGNTLLVGSWHGAGEYQCWHAPSWEEIAEVERRGGGWRRGGE